MRVAVLFLVYYGSALYGFFNPLFGLLFFVHITIFRPESLAWGAPVFGRLHLISAILASVGYFLHRGLDSKFGSGRSQRVNLFVFALFLVWLTLVSVLAEVSQERSFEKLLELAKIFALCFILSRLLGTPRQFDMYIWVVGISFGLLGFWGFLQGLAGNPRLDDISPGGSNYVAAQLALMLPIVVTKTIEPGPLFQRMAFGGSSVAMILCLIFTESRGGFLGFAIALGVLLVSVKRRLYIVLTLMLGAAVILPWIPSGYYQRVSGTFAEEGQRDESSESRLVLWAIAFRIWQDYPIAGVGLGNFSPVKEGYADQVQDLVPTQSMFELIFNRERHTHGLYQGMLAETGAVGVVLFLALLIGNVTKPLPRMLNESDKANIRLVMQMKAIRAGIIGFSVSAIFGDFQYIETFYWQLFLLGAMHDYFARVAADDAPPGFEGQKLAAWNS